jgi:hypothetical protein
MFLGGHPNHQLVFMRIWQIEPSYLTDAFRDFYEESPLNITRILDVAQDLKVGICLIHVSIFLNYCLDPGITLASATFRIRVGRCGARIPQGVFELGQVAGRQRHQSWWRFPSCRYPFPRGQNGE